MKKRFKSFILGIMLTLIATLLSCCLGNFIPQNIEGGLSASAATASVAIVENADSKPNAENPSANLLDGDIGNHSATYTASTEILNIVSGEITGVKSGYESQLTGDLIIPEGMGITKIADSAFSGCTGLTGIAIPSTVYYIGASAFYGCSSLRSVLFTGDAVLASAPGSVYNQGIGNSAFYDCSSITTVSIPEVSSWCAVSFGGEYANPLRYGGDLHVGGSKVTDLTIPSSVTSISDYAFAGLSVDSVTISYSASSSSIGDYAFYLSRMTSISISSSHVSSIGDYAFSGCAQLTSITLPNGVTTIPEGVFTNCQELSSITFGSDTQTIETYAFDGCTSLTSITLPSRLTTIGSFAFSYCEYLTSITIPASVTKIDSNPFNACHSLTSIAVNSSNTAYYSEGNCLIEKSSKTIISGCKSSSIPTDVTAIGDHAFRALKSLTSISIPNSVSSIGKDAFYDCTNLAGITLSNALTSIGSRAFASCSKVLEYDFSSYTAIPSLGSSAFQSINSSCIIRVPASLYTNWIAATNWSTYAKYIVENSGGGDTGEVAGLYKTDGTFVPWETLISEGLISVSGTTLTDVDTSLAGKFVISSSIAEIGTFAARDCNSLTELIIPGSVETIGHCSFMSCYGIKSITLNSGLKTIAYGAFWFTGITNITIPNTVTVIGARAFKDSALTSITISSSVTTIGTTEESGTTIVGNPLENCDKLTSIYVDTNNPNYTSGDSNCLIETSSKKIISGCKNSVIPSSVEIIGVESFAGCSTSGWSITIPSSVTTIEDRAFLDSWLNSVTLNSGLVSIGHSAFSGCVFSSLTIPNTVTTIDHFAFEETRITSITIPASVTSIGSNPFASCTGLSSITVETTNANYYSEGNCLIEKSTKTLVSGCKSSTISNDVIIIGISAFYNCTGLTDESIIPNSVTTISHSAFYNCTGLTGELIIPNSVTTISQSAFYKCSGLTSMTLSNNLTSIGEEAFYRCTGLTSVLMPASLTYIGYAAFGVCGNITSYDFSNFTKIPTLGYSAFLNINENCQILVPSSLYAEWVTTTNWSDYADYIVEFNLAAGLYNPDTDELIYSWEELVDNNLVRVKGTRLVEVKKTLTGRMIVSSDITIIGTGAFVDSLLTELELPDSVITIEDDAIVYQNSVIETQLTTLKIGRGIEYVGNMEFPRPDVDYNHLNADFKLENFYIADLQAWCHADKGKLYIPATNLYVAGAQVTNLVIPEGTECIKQYSFCGIEAITSVSIPSSVEEIGKAAFRETIYNTSFSVDDASEYFSDYNNSGALFDKNETVLYAYPLAKGGAFTVPSSTTTINAYAFEYARNIFGISFSYGLRTIGEYAFASINAESGIAIDMILTASVETLSTASFASANLRDILLGIKIKTIPSACFAGARANSISVGAVTSVLDFGLYFNDLNEPLVFGALTNLYKNAIRLSNDIDFSNCSSIPSIDSESIRVPNGSTYKIYVPNTLYEECIEAENWSNYAEYIYPALKVTFDGNGGTVNHATTMTAYFGKSLALPTLTNSSKTASYREGFTFDGYYSSASVNGIQVFTSTGAKTEWTTTNEADLDFWLNSAANTTLYAHWTANTYTVEFNANGGSGTMSNQSFIYGMSQALSKNTFTRTNYTFLGWSRFSTATSATYTDGQSVKNLATSGTVTLYAVWKSSIEYYKVTLDAQGGTINYRYFNNTLSGTVSQLTVYAKSDSNLLYVSYNSSYTQVTYLSVSLEGRGYMGFYTASGSGGMQAISVSGNSAPKFNITITSETTLYAQYSYVLTVWNDDNYFAIGDNYYKDYTKVTTARGSYTIYFDDGDFNLYSKSGGTNIYYDAACTDQVTKLELFSDGFAGIGLLDELTLETYNISFGDNPQLSAPVTESMSFLISANRVESVITIINEVNYSGTTSFTYNGYVEAVIDFNNMYGGVGWLYLTAGTVGSDQVEKYSFGNAAVDNNYTRQAQQITIENSSGSGESFVVSRALFEEWEDDDYTVYLDIQGNVTITISNIASATSTNNILTEQNGSTSSFAIAEVVIGEDQTTTSAKVWLDDKFRKVQEQQTTNVDFDGVTFDA